MIESQKKEIQMLLKTRVEESKSQAQAAKSLMVSEGTLIAIKKGEWESISDEMWQKLGKQVGFKKTKWQMVETKAFKTAIHFFDDAREYSNVYAMVASAGSGKSFAAEWYEGKRENVYVISCSEYYNRKTFLQEILRKMGKSNTGYSVPEMMDLIVEMTMKKECPLFIFDEFDKVTDSILYFFITFYNRLEGNVGMVMMATEYLQKRIMRGRKLNRKGYAEIYSRIGRRFITMPEATQKEVVDIARANGAAVEDYDSIYNESEGDLRRVKRGVHKSQLKKAKKTA